MLFDSFHFMASSPLGLEKLAMFFFFITKCHNAEYFFHYSRSVSFPLGLDLRFFTCSYLSFWFDGVLPFGFGVDVNKKLTAWLIAFFRVASSPLGLEICARSYYTTFIAPAPPRPPRTMSGGGMDCIEHVSPTALRGRSPPSEFVLEIVFFKKF